MGGAYLKEGPDERCKSPVKPSTVTFTAPPFLASVGGALDVAGAGLAADATPGAHPAGLKRVKVTVGLILNQSKAEKKQQKKKV